MSPVYSRLLAIFIVLALLGTGTGVVRADVLELQPDHPERYTVVDGDTLWSISNRFLKSPWNWPKIWKINQQVENPHLIYPGDVILLRWVDGQPELSVLRPEQVQPLTDPKTGAVLLPEERMAPRRSIGDRERLSPKVRSGPRERAIPTIPPEAIAPFLGRPLIVGNRELDKAGYVTIGLDERRALGDGSKFYARRIRDTSHEFYYVFRKGRPIRDPRNNRLLAYEAIYLGDAKMIQPGRNRFGTSVLIVTKVTQEILPTDRLLPVSEESILPVYHPRPPKNNVRGSIVLAHNDAAEIGPMGVVVINLGEKEGMEAGTVLQIWRHPGKHRDPISKKFYMRPDEKSGLLMVFSTFRRVSYGLVLEADQSIHVFDKVTSP